MCTGSIHVPHRMARETERLVVQKIPDFGNLKGLYPARGEAKLVCFIRQQAILKTVRFEQGMPASVVKAWAGKRNVEVTLRHVPYADYVMFPDGKRVAMNNLVEGTRIDIGIPVKPRKPAGMTVVESAVREALALPPDPKPEDAPAEQPAEPAPEREPAPASDAPAARRRR
jgi:hypothetical protein